MKRTIHLDPECLKIIRQTFIKYLPVNSKLFFFGSRTKGTHKPFSDIDILVDAGNPLTLKQLANLNSAFDESLLPYKVDIADAYTISDAFRLAIHDQLMPFDYLCHR